MDYADEKILYEDCGRLHINDWSRLLEGSINQKKMLGDVCLSKPMYLVCFSKLNVDLGFGWEAAHQNDSRLSLCVYKQVLCCTVRMPAHRIDSKMERMIS